MTICTNLLILLILLSLLLMSSTLSQTLSHLPPAKCPIQTFVKFLVWYPGPSVLMHMMWFKMTEHQSVQPKSPPPKRGPLLSPGNIVTPRKFGQEAHLLIIQCQVVLHHGPFWKTTPHIPAFFVATHAIVHGTAPITDLSKVLYIHTMPYNPDNWQHTLFEANLQSSFPNLVHNLMYSSPISNPPSYIHFLALKCFFGEPASWNYWQWT